MVRSNVDCYTESIYRYEAGLYQEDLGLLANCHDDEYYPIQHLYRPEMYLDGDA